MPTNARRHTSAADPPLPPGTYDPIVDVMLRFVRLRHFTGPGLLKRYYRLFGDLEYDLLALRAETEAMRLRLREVRRRIEHRLSLTPDDERQICVTSHDLTEHRYRRAEMVQAAIARSRTFAFDPEREQQACLLLADIAAAIVGIADATLRARADASLTSAIDAYGRLDLATLIDLHDHVQQFVALQRRERLDESEEREWRDKLQRLSTSHPLCRVASLDDPAYITARMTTLKRRIVAQLAKLEHLAMVYLAAVRAVRYDS